MQSIARRMHRSAETIKINVLALGLQSRSGSSPGENVFVRNAL